MTHAQALDPSLTVNEILGRYPDAIDVFNRMGVDICCGGTLTLAEAIEADGLDEDALYSALEGALSVVVPRKGVSA